ncbi:MAG: Xaa-Pro aminopeptidase [Pseudomonadota bacterium]
MQKLSATTVPTPRTVYAARRAQLMRHLGKDGVALIPAAPEVLRNGDSHYPYRPDSDFYYLTGFAEPEAVAALVPGRRGGEYIVFCRPRDPSKEIWTGRRVGPAGVVQHYGADAAYDIARLDELLPELLKNRQRIFFSVGRRAEFDTRVTAWVNGLRAKARAGVHAPREFVDIEHCLHEQRLFKGKHEIATLRRAAQVSALAHVAAMRLCRPGMMEYELEAVFLHYFRRHNCVPSYNPIVGGGANACILHYNENNMPLSDGDLVLIDAGAEAEYYAGDITRTFPVNGRFSAAQREVYQVVLDAQYAAIAKVRPGNHWQDPHDAAVRVLTRGLIELGLLRGKPAQLIKSGAFRTFYMHRTGHWLGMDVHDAGAYKDGDEWRLLRPGMALTVEPGLYISAHIKGVPKRYWDIGIRIEDDVLVTREGCEVMTAEVPKEAAEIEALMAHGR